MKKKVLIIGYGSIGRRHANLLKKIEKIGKIYILSNQKFENFLKVKNLNHAKAINPDYILICSRTSEHYRHLMKIEKNFKNKKVLIEKPLFDKNKKLKIKKNNVFVGYNLRFNPVINYLKKYIKNKDILSVRAVCQSYLPFWRKNIDYRKSNSARKKYGGGALLELSHEIDYIQWILNGSLNLNYAKLRKISNLEIDTEDDVSIFGKIRKTDILINLNYHSLEFQRLIVIIGKNFKIIADLLKNKIKIIFNNKEKIKKFNYDINQSYLNQHLSILENNSKQLCNYAQGLKLMILIDKIRSFKIYEKK